ncbi:carbohydrate ABC transporter permease [Ornithinimicrobium cerasi]|uniref:Carbohydrate ABC transporter membrane protein 2, CUT1 family n=1 Tax=Ornithinimicrobium cerasi TaxID=2248773 RepID=A0A285VJX1_9MICO|nr:carbohydrate ABC transporter permease [Ornithinimicrobium cerasi]SOC53838.1 carbohydrate ABC transporter membrane protein 2, CUT1 family [Ornithinimicrobium cerasi]
MTKVARNPVLWVLLLLLSIIFMGPLVVMGLTALKTPGDAQAADWSFWPSEFTARAFEVLFSSPDNPILRWFLNSMIAATAHSLLVVITASLAGYALARMDFRGKNLMFAIIISTMFVPGFIFMMPNFLMLDRFGWLDTLLAIVVPGAAGAFGVFFMRQFFLSLPKEFEESARIDGAGPFTTFFRIMLPNATPALVTLLVLSFLANWNDFIWPLYVLFNDANLTLQPGLSKLQGAYTIDYPVIMAGAVIASLPVLILYTFVQRFVIEGVASSGVKG